MGVKLGGWAVVGDWLSAVTKGPRRVLWIVPALLAMCCACSGGGTPSAEDLAAIEQEALAEGAEANTSGSSARQAVRDTLRQVVGACDGYGAEIGRTFWRSELNSYLFLNQSYIGGTFPAGTAELLRKVQELEDSYLADIQGFPQALANNLEKRGIPEKERTALVQEIAGAFAAERKPIITAVEAHRKLVEAAAELYELIASDPESVRYPREGLEISDPSLRKRFDAQIDAVNEAYDATQAALAALDPEQQKSASWLFMVKRRPF
jgi:hypothetical protein